MTKTERLTLHEIIDQLDYLLTTNKIELCAKATNIITEIHEDLILIEKDLNAAKFIMETANG